MLSNPSIRTILVATLCLGPVFAVGQSERDVAEWVIRQGGSVRIEGRLDPIARLEDLPKAGSKQTELRIRGINLVGTLIAPTELKRFSGLSSLRELELPGPIWNPNAGSKLDANAEFEALAG